MGFGMQTLGILTQRKFVSLRSASLFPQVATPTNDHSTKTRSAPTIFCKNLNESLILLSIPIYNPKMLENRPVI